MIRRSRRDRFDGEGLYLVTAQRRFLSLLADAEERLRVADFRRGRSGPILNALVAELQGLVEQSDVVALLLADGDSELAERFDAVVSAWKELR